jgi:hypothetical protein
VSDNIFREVDEEVRREQLQQLWGRYGTLLVVVAFLIVAGVAGWRGYEYWSAKKAAEAGSAFESAVALSQEGKHQEAEQAFAKIAADGNSGYRHLARLREAGELASRDAAAAIKTYQGIAADGSAGQVLQDLATVRAALLQVDTASYEELRGKLEPLTAAERPFRHTAREVLALSASKANDAANTKRWADMILTDSETPSGVRSRIEMLVALAAPEVKS